LDFIFIFAGYKMVGTYLYKIIDAYGLSRTNVLPWNAII